MIPRIRGKVGQADDTNPPDIKGKWFFEMWLTDIGGGEGKSLGQFGPWDTEKKAQAELRNASRMACEAITKKMGGDPGKYVDMHTNELRNWDEN